MSTLIEILEARSLMPFSEFMRVALYEPGLGYYARSGVTRVGASREADFYTSESMGRVFAELCSSAAQSVINGMGAGLSAKDMTFVELGAEPGAANVASHAVPPFGKAITVGCADEFSNHSNEVLLFSNELFDAQPFSRFMKLGGQWRELGVIVANGKARWEPLEANDNDGRGELINLLPGDAPEGYVADIPYDAERLMEQLAAPSSVRAIIAIDYGLDWEDIIRRRPEGTGRAYSKHKVVDSLLENPGEQDLTCQVCWDRLEAVLRARGFTSVSLYRQEAFFVRYAFKAVEGIMKRGDIMEQGKLREIIHPSRLGSAFQVLVATR